MTNAEKLAKSTETMADIIGAMCSAFVGCEGCPMLNFRSAQIYGTCLVASFHYAKKWLESEAEEDAEIH